jgi:hypothetical protein
MCNENNCERVLFKLYAAKKSLQFVCDVNALLLFLCMCECRGVFNGNQQKNFSNNRLVKLNAHKGNHKETPLLGFEPWDVKGRSTKVFL